MTLDEYRDHVKQLAELIKPENDDGKVAVILAKLEDSYTDLVSDNLKHKESIDDLTGKNERLRAGNMELLLSRGSNITSDMHAPPVVEESKPVVPVEELAAAFI